MIPVWSDRRLTLVYAAVAILGVTAVAAALPGLELRSGPRFQLADLDPRSDPALDPDAGGPSQILRWIVAILRIVFFALLPPGLIYFLVSRAARRRVLAQVLSMLLVSYLVLSISPSLRTQDSDSTLPEAAASGESEPIAEQQAAEPPGWLIVTLSSLAALAFMAIAYRLVLVRKPPDSRIGDLRQALRALDRGQESLESIIFRAYRTLCEASAERKGIHRRQAMTPGEYRTVLERASIPSVPLATLTSLFERARYGHARLTHEDELAASGALRAILQEIEPT